MSVFNAAVNWDEPIKPRRGKKKVTRDASSTPNLLFYYYMRERGREKERENETHSLSVMSLRANGSERWYFTASRAPPLCMAAHMVLQHHIFTTRPALLRREADTQRCCSWPRAPMLIRHVRAEMAHKHMQGTSRVRSEGGFVIVCVNDLPQNASAREEKWIRRTNCKLGLPIKMLSLLNVAGNCHFNRPSWRK